MKPIVLLIITMSILFFACKDYKAEKLPLLSRQDSLRLDLLQIYLIAYHEVASEFPLSDQIYPQVDTLFVKDYDLHALKSVDSRDLIKVPIGSFLILKNCDDDLCELDIYNKSNILIGNCFLPIEDATIRINPFLDMQRLTFFYNHERMLRFYREKICKKYGLTEANFDSLIWIEVERIRSSDLHLSVK